MGSGSAVPFLDYGVALHKPDVCALYLPAVCDIHLGNRYSDGVVLDKYDAVGYFRAVGGDCAVYAYGKYGVCGHGVAQRCGHFTESVLRIGNKSFYHMSFQRGLPLVYDLAVSVQELKFSTFKFCTRGDVGLGDAHAVYLVVIYRECAVLGLCLLVIKRKNDIAVFVHSEHNAVGKFGRNGKSLGSLYLGQPVLLACLK